MWARVRDSPAAAPALPIKTVPLTRMVNVYLYLSLPDSGWLMFAVNICFNGMADKS